VKPPTAIEAIFNRVFGWLVGIGLAPAGFYLLEVQGRKTGRVYSTPVDLLARHNRRFLVSPRGYTQWARNAKASGTVTLRRGRVGGRYLLREVDAGEKPEVLKAYLEAFKSQVQRFLQCPQALPPMHSFRLPSVTQCSSLRHSRDGSAVLGHCEQAFKPSVGADGPADRLITTCGWAHRSNCRGRSERRTNWALSPEC
jgi:deazaflavin-dependent oxidoreductase (nitroreductase family)